jgi:hypothetical protein
LNFEITLAIYDLDFTAKLKKLQCDYTLDTYQMTHAHGLQRTPAERLLQNAARLLGPLL